MFLKSGIIFVFTIFLCLSARQAEAIILHPESVPAAEWSGRPHNDVVGRWGSNASCVAVGSCYVITTRHQGGGKSTKVVIGGTEYSIRKIINHPAADLRLIELNDANLAEYAAINFESNEQGKEIVLGGYGLGAGERLEIYQDYEYSTFGYLWDGPETEPNNIDLRWGTNQIEAVAETPPGYFTSDLLVSQFDKPGTTVYECGIAEHDSGGGWFSADPNGWTVMGLSRGVIGFEPPMSVFMTDESPPQEFPRYPNEPLPNYMPTDSDGYPTIYNYIDAVRVSSYAEWITSNIYANELRKLGSHWMRYDCGELNNYCGNSDKTGDGAVDMKDFAKLAGKWLDQPVN